MARFFFDIDVDKSGNKYNANFSGKTVAYYYKNRYNYVANVPFAYGVRYTDFQKSDIDKFRLSKDAASQFPDMILSRKYNISATTTGQGFFRDSNYYIKHAKQLNLPLVSID